MRSLSCSRPDSALAGMWIRNKGASAKVVVKGTTVTDAVSLNRSSLDDHGGPRLGGVDAACDRPDFAALHSSSHGTDTASMNS